MLDKGTAHFKWEVRIFYILLISLLAVFFLYTNAEIKAIKYGLYHVQQAQGESIKKSQQEQNNNFLMNVRVASIASSLRLKNPDKELDFDYLAIADKEIVNDNLLATFYQNMSELTGGNNVSHRLDEKTLNIYQTWLVEFENTDAFLLKSFPKKPFLALDNEVLPEPTCPSEQVAKLVYVKAHRKNTAKWSAEPTILHDAIQKQYVINFEQSDPFNKRLVVILGCEAA